MTDSPKRDEKAEDEKKPTNSAPDAVMDPNEKTDGHPGMGPTGGKTDKDGEADKDADPGGG